MQAERRTTLPHDSDSSGSPTTASASSPNAPLYSPDSTENIVKKAGEILNVYKEGLEADALIASFLAVLLAGIQVAILGLIYITDPEAKLQRPIAFRSALVGTVAALTIELSVATLANAESSWVAQERINILCDLHPPTRAQKVIQVVMEGRGAKGATPLVHNPVGRWNFYYSLCAETLGHLLTATSLMLSVHVQHGFILAVVSGSVVACIIAVSIFIATKFGLANSVQEDWFFQPISSAARREVKESRNLKEHSDLSPAPVSSKGRGQGSQVQYHRAPEGLHQRHFTSSNSEVLCCMEPPNFTTVVVSSQSQT
ncbi:hypothetical protein P7C70_g8299, partial [Phenoliferia sp. Uapishka_3]